MTALFSGELLHTIETTLVSSDALNLQTASLTPPAGTDAVERARQMVATVGSELWATTDADDFHDCLADLVDRRPWPAVEPLLLQLWHQLPRDEWGAVWSHVTRRVLGVFGPAHFVRFVEAINVTQDAARVTDAFRRKVPPEAQRAAEVERAISGARWGEEMFQPGFPQALRRALLGGLQGSLCGVSVVQALLTGEHHPDEKIERVLRAWHEGTMLYAHVLAAFVDDPALTLHFVKLGISLPSAQSMIADGERFDALLDEAIDHEVQALGRLFGLADAALTRLPPDDPRR